MEKGGGGGGETLIWVRDRGDVPLSTTSSLFSWVYLLILEKNLHTDYVRKVPSHLGRNRETEWRDWTSSLIMEGRPHIISENSSWFLLTGEWHGVWYFYHLRPLNILHYSMLLRFFTLGRHLPFAFYPGSALLAPLLHHRYSHIVSREPLQKKYNRFYSMIKSKSPSRVWPRICLLHSMLRESNFHLHIRWKMIKSVSWVV